AQDRRRPAHQGGCTRQGLVSKPHEFRIMADTDNTPAPAADASAAATPAEAKPKPAKKTAPKKKEGAEGAAAAPVAAAAPAADLPLDLNAGIEPIKVVKAKGSKNVVVGIAHVLATFNNTVVSITDQKGNVLGWSSAGKVGFK